MQAVPGGSVQRIGRAVEVHAGIVDQCIQSAESTNARRNRERHRFLIADIDR